MPHLVLILPVVLVGLVVPGPDFVRAATTRQGPPPQQTEVDKRYEDLMRVARSRGVDPAVVVPQLEQFIRDHPDYPRLDHVYARLLSAVRKGAPERVHAVADEFLAKFPASESRAGVYEMKFILLKEKNDAGAIGALALAILKTETQPAVLRNAAEHDPAHGLQLLDRAIAQRRKLKDPDQSPTLLDLKWSYAKCLHRLGRIEESFKMAFSVIDETTETLNSLEGAADDRSRGRVEFLQEDLQNRYAAFVGWCVDGGRRDLALEFLKRQERAGRALRDRAQSDRTRGELYGRLGMNDLALEAFVSAYAQRMDRATHENIITLAGKLGRKLADVFARAQDIRTSSSRPAYRFSLATDTGGRLALAEIKAQVVLLEFFFPT